MTRRKYYIPFFLFMLLATYLVNRHVVYFGDDYWFSRYWGENVYRTFSQHYKTETGRILINLVGMVMTAAPGIWKIVNSLMIASIVTLSGLMVLKGERNVYTILAVFSVLCASFLLLDVDITRQSVYWIAGSVNYVLPYMLFMLLWWGIVRIEKRRAAILPAFAILAGCSSEQTGMMAIGLCTLYIFNDIIMQKQKPRREYVFSLLTAAAGALTIYLAPGTTLRFGLESAGDFSTAGELVKYNLRFMLSYFTQSPYTLFMQLFILLSTGLFLYRHADAFLKRQRIIIKTLALLSLPAAALLIYMILSTGEKTILYTAFIWAIRAFYLVSFIAAAYILLRHRPTEDYMIPLSAAILAVGSQIMMVISPAIGPRTTLCALLLAGLYSAYMVRESIHGISMYIVTACAALLLILSVMKLSESVKGYGETEHINNENEALIMNYNGSGELLQYMFTNTFCWSMPYQSPFHESCYKRHFGLKPDTSIMWKEYPK